MGGRNLPLLGEVNGIVYGKCTTSSPTISKGQLNYGFLLYTAKGGTSFRPAIYSLGKQDATAIYEGVNQPTFTMDSTSITFQELSTDVFYMYIKLMG